MEIFWFIILSIAGGLAGLIFFLYHLVKDQFEDSEEPKYQMFLEEESEDA